MVIICFQIIEYIVTAIDIIGEIQQKHPKKMVLINYYDVDF